jgi:type IV secretion system protein VirB10
MSPVPTLHVSPPAPARTLGDADLGAQCRERSLRAAMAPPIVTVAFEARSLTARGGSSERSAPGIGTAPTTAWSIVPAAALATAQAVTADLPSAPRPAAPPVERPEAFPAALCGPVNPYEVKAGTIIPAVLLTGVNSDLRAN